jgi:hypothetical protein
MDKVALIYQIRSLATPLCTRLKPPFDSMVASWRIARAACAEFRFIGVRRLGPRWRTLNGITDVIALWRRDSRGIPQE